MQIIADLHIHSRFSRACSKDINIENLEKFAKIKGVNLLGTGDFQHPEWNKELHSKLIEEDGILKTKTGFPFIAQTEISLMYKQDGKGRRIHHIILAPGMEVMDQITAELGRRGRLDYDGRPIFGFTSIELIDMLNSISKKCVVIPAHLLTPYFGVLGSKSGFDSVEQCFKEKTKYIYALETGLSCYDKETEVLTENGWKKFNEVKYTDLICTLNPKTYKVEYQKPTRVVSSKYKGKMYKLKTKRVDLFVTPNHNLFVSHCDFRKSPKFLLKKAEDIFQKSKRLKKDGIWKGKQEKYFVLPAVKIKHGSRYYKGLKNKKDKEILIEDWLKFFGFWLAEGWTNEGKNGHYSVCISNQNGKLMNGMKKTIKKMGYNFYHDDKTNYTIRIRDYQLFHYLRQFGKSKDKFIPLEIKRLSKELLKILFKYYIKGDGHIYGRNGKGLSATTISIKLRDDLQEIALKMGMSAYYKLHVKKGTPFSSPYNGKIYKQNADSWVIYFIRQNVHTVLPSTIKKYKYIESWVDFQGQVYCVTVPNHVIYVRRNGIPLWCGNSDPPMNWRISSLDKFNLVSFSDMHSYHPWRIGREATLLDTKLTYDNIFKAIKTGEGLTGTVEVNPAYGIYHEDGHRNCNIRLEPKESIKLGNKCPKCGKPLTIGVLHRVEELADREEGYVKENPKKFYEMMPIHEILSGMLGKGLATKTVAIEYNKLLSKFNNEYEILLTATEEELSQVVNPKIAKMIITNRNGKIKVSPGYDGIYGTPIF